MAEQELLLDPEIQPPNSGALTNGTIPDASYFSQTELFDLRQDKEAEEREVGRQDKEARGTEVGNNISINEFRDTIGVCKVRPLDEAGADDEAHSGNVEIVFSSNASKEHESPRHTEEYSEGALITKKSLVTLNSEIMEILQDLDGVLYNNSAVGRGDFQAEEVEGALKRCGQIIVSETPELPTAITTVDVEEMELEGQRLTAKADRRHSMRMVTPMGLPNLPIHTLDCSSVQSVSAPQELTLSAVLFLESQDPERFSQLRPSSATEGPRERGRRALPARRCTSLHVHPRPQEPPPVHSVPLPDRCDSTPTEPQRLDVESAPVAVASEDEEDEETSEEKERWPIKGSCPLVLVSCTLSGYSICRFALFALHFGANFVVQFLLLSVMFGIPLLCLFASFGRALNSGPLGSWRVSPLFLGLGVALLLSQVFLAAYYVAGLSWLLVYLRDSFVSHSGLYRWADPFSAFTPTNSTEHLPFSIPSYLDEVVLRRSESPTLPFQSLFHISLLWVAVAVILSKGLSSYGKVIFGTTLVPVLCLCALVVRLLSLGPAVLGAALPYANWGEFFINSRCWSAAAGECFMTWGLMSSTVWALCGSPSRRHSVVRHTPLLLAPCVLLTLLALACGLLVAGACHGVLRQHHYHYAATSYEQPSWRVFLSQERASYQRHAAHHSALLGVSVAHAGADPSQASGFQLMRLATEIFPAAASLLTTSQLSSFWSILFYLSLLLLGISQLCALTWGVTATVIEICPRALRGRRGILSLACCAAMLLASLPLARGLALVYLLDHAVVGIWWQCLLQVITLAVFFLVRGRPYAADALASAFLSPASTLVPVLAFTWNVVLPIAMIVECVVDFRVGKYKQVLVGSPAGYWTGGARIGIALLQLLPLVLVPLLALVQCWRYLSKGPSDILERIQLLYRPVLDERGRTVSRVTTFQFPTAPPASSNTAPVEPSAPPEDPPPKYTPPPSYSTATGARIAKFLSHSIRRSIRRVRKRISVAATTEGDGSAGAVGVQLRNLRAGYRSFRDKKRAAKAEVVRASSTLPRPRPPALDELAGPHHSGSGRV